MPRESSWLGASPTRTTTGTEPELALSGDDDVHLHDTGDQARGLAVERHGSRLAVNGDSHEAGDGLRVRSGRRRGIRPGDAAGVGHAFARDVENHDIALRRRNAGGVDAEVRVQDGALASAVAGGEDAGWPPTWAQGHAVGGLSERPSIITVTLARKGRLISCTARWPRSGRRARRSAERGSRPRLPARRQEWWDRGCWLE